MPMSGLDTQRPDAAASATLSNYSIVVLDDIGALPPGLPPVQIGIMKRAGVSPSLMNAITAHISACLDNMTPPMVDDDLDGDVKSITRVYPRMRSNQILPSW